MKSIERKDLVDAVLASRDEVDPDLETGLLEAIVDAEIDSAGDGDAAMRAIDAALTAAIGRRPSQTPRADVARRSKVDRSLDGGFREGRPEC